MKEEGQGSQAIRQLQTSMQGGGQEPLRLNRFLAVCGLGSRRGVEELIYQGRVLVNGEKVQEPGRRVDWNDHVTVNGKLLVLPREHSYLAYNKPVGLVVSKKKQGRRPTIFERLPPELSGHKYAGRLDAESRGLIILSDDGKFIHSLSHPTFRLLKYYRVRVSEIPARIEMHFGRGVFSDGEFLKASRAFVVDPAEKIVEVILAGGKNRQIRRMFAVLGVEVLDLYRYRIGKLDLDQSPLGSGETRSIKPEDILESQQPFAGLS